MPHVKVAKARNG